jgi:hypothetical protein
LLEEYERTKLASGEAAYVFVTNLAFHHQLDRAPPHYTVAPFGLGIPTFHKGGYMPVAEAYRQKHVLHKDAIAIIQQLRKLTVFPSTFDGSLPSEAFDGARRYLIGEEYFFETLGESGSKGRVMAGDVNEERAEMYLTVRTDGGASALLPLPMSTVQLEDYRRHRDAYFGVVKEVREKRDDTLGVFEWLMGHAERLSRGAILTQLAAHPDRTRFEAMDDEELRISWVDLSISAVMSRADPKPLAPPRSL